LPFMHRRRKAHEKYRRARDEATELKHAILESYLAQWSRVLGRVDPAGNRRVLHYIDTHAFCGRYDDGAPGSAIIAIQQGETVHRDIADAPQLDCHFIEIDEEWFDDLDREVRSALREAPSVTARTYRGDWRETIAGVLAGLPRWHAAFLFLDPFGYEIPMADVAELLCGRPRSELFITFMDQPVARFMSDPDKQGLVDQLFGTSEWKHLNDARRGEKRLAVVDFYVRQLRTQLEDPCGIATPIVYPIQIHRENSPYCLVHAAQHPKARQEMERAVKRGGARGSMSTFRQGELLLPASTFAAVRKVIGERPGQRCDDLAAAVWQEHVYTTYEQLRSLVGDLVERGDVRRETATGTRTSGNKPQSGDRLFPVLEGTRRLDQGGLFS